MSNVVKLKPKQQPAKLRCVQCGATTDAACHCNVAYVPALKKAQRELRIDPDRSNSVIAAEAGVSPLTVKRARKSSGSGRVISLFRVGKDGRKRKVCKPTGSMIQMAWRTNLMRLASEATAMEEVWTRKYDDKWKNEFTPPPEIVELVTRAAESWQRVARLVKKQGKLA